jgi:hypothetical protein
MMTLDNHASSRVAFDLIAKTMKAAESLIERPQRDRCQDALGAFFFRLGPASRRPTLRLESPPRSNAASHLTRAACIATTPENLLLCVHGMDSNRTSPSSLGSNGQHFEFSGWGEVLLQPEGEGVHPMCPVVSGADTLPSRLIYGNAIIETKWGIMTCQPGSHCAGR